MKIKWGDFDVEISDWTPALKAVTVLFSVITVLSAGSQLLFQYTIRGIAPISFGVVMLLLGIREWNLYFKGHQKMQAPLCWASSLHFCLLVACVWVSAKFSLLLQEKVVCNCSI